MRAPPTHTLGGWRQPAIAGLCPDIMAVGSKTGSWRRLLTFACMPVGGCFCHLRFNFETIKAGAKKLNKNINYLKIKLERGWINGFDEKKKTTEDEEIREKVGC